MARRLPGMSHGTRRAALRASMQAAGLDSLLVTNLLNVRYLTGFTGSNGALLVAADGDEGTVLCTDGRYDTQSARQVPDLRRLIDRPCDVALVVDAADSAADSAANSSKASTVGFESHHVTVDGLSALADAAPALRLQRAPGLV